MKFNAHELMKWAKNETDLAATIEMSRVSDPEEKLKIAKGYEAAFFAYCDVISRFNNLDNIIIAEPCFINLYNGRPLTPIEGLKEEWELILESDGKLYQNKRLPSLYKKITIDKDGNDSIKYSDENRAICIDINFPVLQHTGGFPLAILDDMLPITMPYSPGEKIKIYIERFKYHNEDNKDYDTIGILYFRLPNGEFKEVKRFFKIDHTTGRMSEIDKTEYLARKKKVESKEGANQNEE